MKRLAPRLSYANVVSTLCLFLLLGGGAAYAATHLPRNSVGTRQLRNGSVTAAKVRPGAITGSKLDLSSLGAVPSATTATSAGTAATATRAADAEALGGLGAAGYERRAEWVLVARSGAILEQSGGVSLSSDPFPGAYYVHFPEPVLGKALLVSTTQAGGGPAQTIAQATPCGNVSGPTIRCGHGPDTTSDVLVETSAGGGEEEASFYLAVLH